MIILKYLLFRFILHFIMFEINIFLFIRFLTSLKDYFIFFKFSLKFIFYYFSK